MASELKVDKFTGVTTAGSIVVTGEGNSTTTSLQQGLAKSFVSFITSSSTAVLGSQSFNLSSLTDTASGKTTVTITNPHSNLNFPYADSAGDDNGGYSTFNNIDTGTTSSRLYAQGNQDFSAEDGKYLAIMSFGDLA
jgi:hypothetical protein|tara:strand:- start:483 stop:893 length:411 start_codon:yes stop_codon:yes gene_type:complete